MDNLSHHKRILLNLIKIRRSCERHNLPKPPHLDRMIASAKRMIAEGWA